MRIHADFTQQALVIPHDDDWICSPESGVDRLMLDRIGDEVARATSLVRYAKGSRFSRHEHEKGEEFLVLEGIFSDESGDYPTGTYVRNPPGSGHAPHSRDGCRIFVKLRQFDLQDLDPVVIDTNNRDFWASADSGSTLPLHRYGDERVRMHHLSAGQKLSGVAPAGGLEILLVRGVLRFGDRDLSPESWLRLPSAASYELRAEQDAVLWIKSGHLPKS